MNKSTEQALISLIPSYNGDLPSELTTLASSLLAQSRSKASSLKPEEEIARTYTCAHLACERLKQQLNLPKIVSRPPIPPRNYKKVYAYFDAQLTSRPPQRAHTEKTPTNSPSKVAVTPSTSRKAASTSTPSKARGATSNTPKPSRMPITAGQEAGATDSAPDSPHAEESTVLPPWIPVTADHLASAYSNPRLTPYLLAGLRSVLSTTPIIEPQPVKEATPPPTTKRPRRAAANAAVAAVAEQARSHQYKKTYMSPDTLAPSQLPALMITLSLYILTRLSGQDTTAEGYVQQRDLGVYSLLELQRRRRAGPDGKETAEAGGWSMELTEEELVRDVELLMRRAQEGWLRRGWFVAIPTPIPVKKRGRPRKIVQEQKVVEEPPKEDVEVEEEVEDNGLKWGLGTMMQDAVDWLSEERRRAYRVWERGMWERIAELQSDRMDVDSPA